MRHTTVFLALITTLLLLLSGCGAEAPGPIPQTRPPSNAGAAPATGADEPLLDQDLPPLAELGLDDGETITYDSDGDGEDDRLEISFDPIEVADGVTLARSVVFDTTEEKPAGEMVIEFEAAPGVSEYEHIEDVPKSFAAHVDDLMFEPEPDEILEADPKAKFLVSFVERTRMRIAYTTVKNTLSGEGGMVTAIETADDVRLLSWLEKIRAAPNPYAMVTVIGLFPDQFSYGDCDAFRIDDDEQVFNLACRAFMGDGVGACYTAQDMYRDVESYDQVIGGFYETRELSSTKEDEIRACKAWLFKLIKERCKDIKDADSRDDCLFKAAQDAELVDGCRLIKDIAKRAACYADLGQNDSLCVRLSDPDEARACCDRLRDEAQRSRCKGFIAEEEYETATYDVGTIDITYEPYDDELETGKYYNFSFSYAGTEPAARIYHIDWGDGGFTSRTYDTVYRHSYSSQGVYTVRVTLNDTAANRVVAAGEIKVETKYPYERLALLHDTTHLLMSVCGDVKETFSDGTSYDRPGLCLAGYQPQAEVYWSGRQFSVDFDEQVNEQTYIRLRMDGVVDDNATMVENANAQVIYEYTGGSYDGQRREEKFSISGLPLRTKSPIPTVRTDWYKPQFFGFAEGANASRYVDHTERTYLLPTRDDPHKTATLGPFVFTDMGNKAQVLIVFKTERITAYDDPGYI
ncbi:PKD domain-containing protein [Candidatus Woesearchaeota archaeon]|nr:PKD domain-containing protein [Candidatus Woesearchaeota archaeon]